MSTFPLLRLTDGTTTVTILNGSGTQTNYSLIRDTWAPQIAARNPSPYGDLYEPVVETFDLNIYGANASDAYTNLETLVRLLDQADRWAANPDQSGLSPVLIEYDPQGSAVSSSAAPYQALVLGRGPDDNTRTVQVSEGYITSGLNFQIPEVRVQIRRRALWLEFAADTAVTSSSANSGNVWSTTHPNHATPSPVDLRYTIFASAAHTYAVGDGPLVGLIAPSTADLGSFSALSANSATGSTTVATSQSFSGTAYRRWTTGAAPATYELSYNDANAFTTFFLDTPGGSISARTVPGTYVIVAQQRSTASTFSMRVAIRDMATKTGDPALVTPWVPVPANSNNFMRPLILGSITIPPDLNLWELEVQISKVGTGVDVLDVDFFSVIRLGDLGRVVIFDPLGSVDSAAASYLDLEHNYTSHPLPSSAFLNADYGPGRWAWRGNLPVYLRGTTIAGIWLFGTQYGPIRMPWTSGGGLNGITRVTRRRGRLFPV